jgi:flagellum-specific ATP synthase
MVLSRKLAHNGHYPAIDILQSISRLRGDVTESDHNHAAIQVCKAWAAYHEAKDLIDVGAYVSGSNPDIDWAIGLKKPIEDFLKQGMDEPGTYEDTVARVKALMGGGAPMPTASNPVTSMPAVPSQASQPVAPPIPAENDGSDLDDFMNVKW